MTVLGSSAPSPPTTVVDVATITNFKARFFYNYYTNNELTNAPSVIQSGVAVPNTEIFSANVPRYVRLNWNTFRAQSTNTVQQEFVNVSIAQNAQFIIDNNLFASRYFGVYSQQELKFSETIQSYLSALWRRLGVNPVNSSIVDVIRQINQVTSGEINEAFLNRYLNYATSTQLITRTVSSETELLDRLENIVTNINVANIAFGNLFYDKVLSDSLMPINKTAVSNIIELFNRQIVSSRAELNQSSYDVSVYTPIATRTVEGVPYFSMAYQHTGFILKRYVVTSDGTQTNDATYYIEDPNVTEYFDTQVFYDKTYRYEISPIILAQSMGQDIERSLPLITTFLVQGDVTTTILQSVDVTPPEPPTDFFIRWDYGLKKPVLTWNFPIDSRRNIKYFQVFRRRNIGLQRPAQLPFELVRMYDFNDLQNANNIIYRKPAQQTQNQVFSFLKRNTENNIISNIIIDVKNTPDSTFISPTMYVDEEFDDQGYFIYAVACVDAHGLSSNYSNQIGIRWNKERNTIDLIDISAPNAPKCYPNLYLEKDAFVDTIKNEGYSQMTVVFNPEYMNVVDNEGLDLQFLATKPDSKYRIQLINTDLQEDQFFDFTIKDQR